MEILLKENHRGYNIKNYVGFNEKCGILSLMKEEIIILKIRHWEIKNPNVF